MTSIKETVAEALFDHIPISVDSPRPPWLNVTDSIAGDVWRGHAGAALHAIRQHRDDLARGIEYAIWKHRSSCVSGHTESECVTDALLDRLTKEG